MSAYSDEELARIEETLGAKARRNAVARFDIRQRHLTEFATRATIDDLDHVVEVLEAAYVPDDE